jgi:tryptophanyl-tRNA synthetase
MQISRVLSGVRPTGSIHLGNYLGAIRNWVHYQEQALENYFCIVDLHALTTVEETQNLTDHTRMVAAAYLAAGIDPNKSTIFVQSHVPAHTELAWILSCVTPLGWLNRMTQFKDKAGKHKDLACLGLYSYPVLMAADILVYKASHVPVGEDQKQHLELARDIAGMFNRQFETEVFPLPEPMILGAATRVMSLRDGTSKMSKSEVSDYSRINLMDSPDEISLKIRKAKTDTDPLPRSLEELINRPEARNLINIFAAITGRKETEICQHYQGSTFAPFKKDLTDALIENLTPIRERMTELLQHPQELDQLLLLGAEKARDLSQKHMNEVRQAIGMIGFKSP